MRKFLATGAVLSFALSLAVGAEEKEIQELYRRGLRGDKEAVEACITALESAIKLRPENQLARVYLGSSYTLRSRDLGFGPRKLQALKQGLALMDQAVAAAPDEPKVRLARALTTSALPGFFGRAAESRRDFEQLAEVAERSSARIEAGDLQIIYYHAGLAAQKKRDRARASQHWKQALRYPADATLAQEIEAELAKL